MNDDQTSELNMGQSVRAYLATRPADVPAGSRAATVLGLLDAAITQTEQNAAKQIAAELDRQEQTEQKRLAIKKLYGQMQAMNRIARSIDEQLPGIADQFKLGRGGDQDTLNRARSFITNATPIPNEFISRGMPATFLADMQAAIDDVDAAEERQSVARAAQSAATAAIVVSLKQLRTAVRELDAIFTAKYHNDPATLAEWKTASHVETPKEKTQEPTSPPSSPPSA